MEDLTQKAKDAYERETENLVMGRQVPAEPKEDKEYMANKEKYGMKLQPAGTSSSYFK